MKDDYDISALKRKKKVNSRTKGSTFERNIAKLLNERLKTTEFSRTPGSGAFATTHSLPDHLKIYGDLITPINFKYCIECKKGYNKESLYSIFNYSSDFWGFVNQCQKDSEKCSKLPLVIFKQDRQPTLAIILSQNSSQPEPTKTPYFEINQNRVFYKVCLFDELLKEPDSFWIS